MEEPLVNPIEEYFKEGVGGESTFQELFEAKKDDVDLKTELTWEELTIVNKLIIDNEFLKDKLNLPLFDKFIESYLRLKISKDRASRHEFVDINRRDNFRENLRQFGDFSNIMDVKK